MVRFGWVLMKEELEALGRQLAAFEFAKCGMLHESIQRIPGSDEPMHFAAAEHGYLRSEYCSSSTRRNRLSCAHTAARIDFESILDALPRPPFEEEQVEGWKHALESLDQAVIQVDWQKSDSELDHARLSEALIHDGEDESGIRERLEQTNQQIQRQIALHGEYVVRLKELRDEVLAAVRAVEDADGGH